MGDSVGTNSTANTGACIETADHQIDKLVHELYDLSEDEIAIVEGLE